MTVRPKPHIEAARSRIAPFIRLTPLVDVTLPTPSGPVSLALKLENLQVTGSFKSRGAFNSLPRIGGVVCGGNADALPV